jgi:DNA gyrase/topoisomerase IV subunit B
MTPLIVCTVEKERKYFYTLEEFSEFTSKNKVTNVNYLKGLGSLSPEDWENVMKNKILFSVINDRSANRFLDIAFGDSSAKRRKWLEGL